MGVAFGLGMGWICLLGRQHLRVLHLHWVWERGGRSSEFKILNKQTLTLLLSVKEGKWKKGTEVCVIDVHHCWL